MGSTKAMAAWGRGDNGVQARARAACLSAEGPGVDTHGLWVDDAFVSN